MGDDGRRVSRSQDIRNSYFHNYGKGIDRDGRSGYRYHAIPSTSHHSVELGILMGFSISSHNISVNRSQTSQSSSYYHGGLYIFRSRFPQEAIPRSVKGENSHQNYPYYSYPIMAPHLHTIMPPHSHQKMPPHHYPSMPPPPICYFPYFTYTPMYEPYVVSHHHNISSLGYLNRQPSRLPPSMLSNLLPPGDIYSFVGGYE